MTMTKNVSNLLLIRTEEYPGKSVYEPLLTQWANELKNNERFGVMVVHHDHHQPKEDESDQSKQSEQSSQAEPDDKTAQSVSALITKFRQTYRAKTNVLTTGFATVYPPATVAKWTASNPDMWDKVQKRTSQFARYTWGIRGEVFTSEAAAQAWLVEVSSLPPIFLKGEQSEADKSQTKVGLIYGSTAGTTEHIAGEIEHFWQEQSGQELPVFNIAEITELSSLLSFDTLIIGVPTWNIGELQDDWLEIFPNLDELDFSGKQVALFGIGDQHHYSDNFQDALGILGRKFRECGAELVGFTSTEGYDFEASQGIEDGQFMGLAIDDLNQPELNEPRIISWVAQLIALTETVGSRVADDKQTTIV